MSTEQDSQQEASAEATLERGTYEILRDRLLAHAGTLRQRADALNEKRIALFGGNELALVGNERIRTENNCVPRDIIPVGDFLLFGYNVFLGLKTETDVADVFSLHRFTQDGERFVFDTVPAADTFLADSGFVRDFKELYKYYKETRLLQLRRLTDGKLLAVFQTGAALSDVKVFRWAIDPNGAVTYIDNRGERDYVFPPAHDFEWTITGRDDYVLGRHPHVSILDEVFVETVGGDLTVKVEDNTEDGLGIYRELVDEADQSLADAEVHYAKLGVLILLKVRPYNEQVWRYLVFNTRTHKVDRIDAIGQSCVQLPEDHGLIFPGGYYLQSGETKTFEGDVAAMELQRVVRSPNGEDVLYIFHHRGEGRSLLLPYNLIRKQVQSPVHCHGFSLFDDGKLVIFRSTTDEPTRVHPMQVWQTPFHSDEHAAQAPATGSYLETVGNADLVRGISEALSICRLVENQEPSVLGYEDLIAAAVRTLDAYYWYGHEEVGDLGAPCTEIRTAADQIVAEFEKVETIRRRAVEAVAAAEEELAPLFRSLTPESWQTVDPFVDALAQLRNRRGHLISLKELRYVDGERVDELEAKVVAAFEDLAGHAAEFLQGEEALAPYHQAIEDLVADVEKVAKVSEAAPLSERLDKVGADLDLLTEIVDNLEIEDATVRTRILESISTVMAGLNRARALLVARRKELQSAEGSAEFGAQLKLLGQSVSSALAVADTPTRCDEQLAKLLLQLEEMESRFGELDDFLEQLATKREDIYEALSTRKQTLMDERQRRAQRLMTAAARILEGIGRRAAGFKGSDELNAYFAGDAMVAKVRDIAAQLRELEDSVKADELDSRLKAAREDAARALRDRQDLFEDGAEVIRLGRHRFSVNTQPLALTVVPRGEGEETAMAFHLTGTDFYEPVADEGFAATRDYWDQLLVSESPAVYRSEYLAYSVLTAAEEGEGELSLSALQAAAVGEEGLLNLVRRFATERYDEGYERGLHDHDAALILDQLLGLYATAELLRFAPRPRAAACLFWAFHGEQTSKVSWERRARSLARLRAAFAHSPEIARFTAQLAAAVAAFFAAHDLPLHEDEARLAGAYLFEELARHPLRFITSAEAVTLRDAFADHLRGAGSQRDFEEDLRELEDDLHNRHHLAVAWLQAFLDGSAAPEIRQLAPVRDEAVVLLLSERRLDRTTSNALTRVEVEGLLGQHPRLEGRTLTLRLGAFLARLGTFQQHRVPGFRRFQTLRHELLEVERQRLRLEEYAPKVMSAFVRNRLISEVYLPIIGDNLAKQLGALGEGKRTDQMGLLLLISPPGYGKTTLMEYVANRLGMIFVKVNGPALGHSVTSIDPDEAPNATARQEVEKINFALEMGNNVLLYLDDIQHTHSELLQKFISLCDAQRRMEGVWRGRTRTYDLRGKRFAVCMAGNPYTESGEKFQIPDMLANRADTYNLGDILEGKDDVFALSYLENALTSSPTLAPLTTRDPADFHLLVRMARGEEIPPDQLNHDYAAVELEEMLTVLRKLLRVQEVVLAVNQQYILSASQDDAFRTEPRFQLQGSYRNMNKLAEKVVAVMNDRELEALIDDHYAGEAQTLTTGAEHNLLKLGELRGILSDADKARWEEIKRGFARVQAMGGAEDDPAVRMLGQLGLVSDRLGEIGRHIEQAGRQPEEPAVEEAGDDDRLATALSPYLGKLDNVLAALGEAATRAVAAGRDQASAGDDPRLAAALEQLGTVAGNAAERMVAARDPAADLGPYLEKLDTTLAALASTVASAPAAQAVPVAGSGAPAAPASDLGPYLDKLGQTLNTLAAAPRGAQVIQALEPGVLEVLKRMTETVAETLLPLVQGLGRRMKGSELDQDRRLTDLLDRTLKNLDSLKDLLAALRKIDTRSLASNPGES